MAERLKRVPFWYIAASAVTIMSLAACQLRESFGYVTPSPEGTSTNPAETVPSHDQIAETKKIPIHTETHTPEAPASTLPPDFTQEYLARFENAHSDTRLVGDIQRGVLLGTNLTDGREQVIGMEMDGVMVRMGEYIDPEGHIIYAYIRPDYNLDGRIQVTEKTPEVLFEFFLKSISQGEFKSQTGGDIEKMRKIIWEQNGKLKFKVPTAPDATDPLYKDPWANVWRNLPTQADFNQPIEIIVVGSEDELSKLPLQIQELYVHSRARDFLVGGLVWVSPAGRIQVFAIDSVILKDFAADPTPPKNAQEEKNVKKYLRSRVGWKTLKTVEILDNWSKGTLAYLDNQRYTGAYLDLLARNLFEYVANPYASSK